jgi:hypothetical protein
MCPECRAILDRYDAATIRLSELTKSLRDAFGTDGFADAMQTTFEAHCACIAARAELDRHRDNHK